MGQALNTITGGIGGGSWYQVWVVGEGSYIPGTAKTVISSIKSLIFFRKLVKNRVKSEAPKRVNTLWLVFCSK